MERGEVVTKNGLQNHDSCRLDPLTPAQRSERMGRVRGKDTKPEMFVRRMIHALGYRYRLHNAQLPGKPDLVFSSRRKVIFVHGCFWHRHPGCKNARLPKSRRDFWIPKLNGNRERDLRNHRALREMGFQVMVIWECQIQEPEMMRRRVVQFLERGEQ